MRRLIGIIVFISLSAFAKEELGRELKLKETGGKKSLGVVFSIAVADSDQGVFDPDGNNYLLTLTNGGPALPSGTTWNLYRKDTETLVYKDWPVSLGAIGVFQTKITDEGPVRAILPFQTKLVLIFKTKKDERYHVDLGKLCEDKAMQTYFQNLTNHKTCDEISTEDLGR